MNERLKDKNFIMLSVVTIMLVAILIKLVVLQVVNGEDYRRQSMDKLTNSVTVPAPRGVIYDRNGVPLITNRVGFSVQVVYSSEATDKINDVLLATVNVLSKNGEKYVDSLPISKKAFVYTYKDDEINSRKSKIKAFKEKYGISRGADGKQTLRQLAKRYDLDDRYTYDEIRKIVGMRYEMETRGLAYGAPVTIASDVSMDTVSVFKENSAYYFNINVISSPFREYVHGSMASHILGRVGVIYQEEYEKLKDKNYGMNDIIGKEGLEKHLEFHLKGTDGKINRHRSTGSDSYAPDEIAAIPGNDAILTIDYELQKATEEILKETIENIKRKGLSSDDKAGADAGGGAVVVIDVRNGEILAMTSYPDFNPDTFDEDYTKLLEDKGNPLFNRCISGTYPPGSVFKIVTAIAGLEEGVITPQTTIYDKGKYEYYGQTFNCWIWSQSRESHENQNVAEAIGNSCNSFFYEVGKHLGEKKIYNYADKFGLGKKTGIEIEGETSGILANEKYKDETFHQVWYPGDTLQAAIGQSDNAFTPLQLCSYMSTVLNGGTRYKATLLKSVNDYNTKEVVVDNKPVVLDKTELSEDTVSVLKTAMRQVVVDGTARNVFDNYPYAIGGKTGTAQVSGGSDTALFVGFAPYDNPEIVVSVVVENAAFSYRASNVAKAVFDYYFENNETKYE